MKDLPTKYNHEEVEGKWINNWQKSPVYSYDPNIGRENTFSVDTPPPTVSGSLHMGHVFSYTQTDLIVRYKRMQGMNIFYPMGWDDNGLPTERRAQNVYGVNPDLHVPYDENWHPDSNNKKLQAVSRLNFIEACQQITHEDEKAFESLYRKLGLSVDWGQHYCTIDDHCRKTSQYSFLDLAKKKMVYQVKSPTMWDVSFKTAVAQAEVEDRNIAGAYHDLTFGVEGGGEFIISTTRPELLAACIAVVAHPDDERYRPFFGKTAITPLFGDRVPIMSAEHADPEKGTGILMVCTFGDSMDVEWWKKSGLPLKQIIGADGRMLKLNFASSPFNVTNAVRAQNNYQTLTGCYIKEAQKQIVSLLQSPGSSYDGQAIAMTNAPKPIEHPVKFYEKGERPLEFIITRQWFIKILDYKNELLEQGKKINWHPEHMRHRYEHWVEGLNQDWCISRQRFFGVPFPVWYPVDNKGNADYDRPIFPDKSELPIDPMTHIPKGYQETQRGVAGGFIGEPDVMDTWATSSLTPQIADQWVNASKIHKNVFPYDIRPQAHEIIRTWAFYTITKAWMHENQIPWKNVCISGWILDPDRKKMSKSKGNVVTPEGLLREYSSDAIRYWSARARLGVDTAYDPSVFKVGRRLTTKLFNAGRFVFMQLGDKSLDAFPVKLITEPLDCAYVNYLGTQIKRITSAWEKFDYAQGLALAEDAFWNFCDHYMELVKNRSYKEIERASGQSAIATLIWSFNCYLRLLAPIIPFVTEEIWSWGFGQNSIHREKWPAITEISQVSKEDESLYLRAIEVLTGVRSAKSVQQKNMKWPVSALTVKGNKEGLDLLDRVKRDVLLAANAQTINMVEENIQVEKNYYQVDVELAADG